MRKWLMRQRACIYEDNNELREEQEYISYKYKAKDDGVTCTIYLYHTVLFIKYKY